MAPSLQASAACFFCCPQESIDELGAMNNNSDSSCHDFVEGVNPHFNLGIACGQSDDPVMSCCLDKSNNVRLASDDNNKRPENNLILSSILDDFNHGLLINNNYSIRYISFIAPPPQLEPLGSVLKRE